MTIKKPLSIRDLAVAVAIFTLPNALPEFFGWLYVITPLPVFHALLVHSQKKGMALIVRALGIAAAILLVAGSLKSLPFTFALLPLGFSLAQSARAGHSAEAASFRGAVALLVGYLALWFMAGWLAGANPYQELLTGLDTDMALLAESYMNIGKAEGLPADTLNSLAAAFRQVRDVLPHFLPGMLLATMLFQVWAILGMGSLLMRRLAPGLIPWQDLRTWRLPESLVWAVIAGTVAVLLPIPAIGLAGTNVLMVLAALYFLQGVAVISSLLRKRRLPRPLRVLAYILLLVQGYGILVVIVTGVADVWADFRKPRSLKENPL